MATLFVMTIVLLFGSVVSYDGLPLVNISKIMTMLLTAEPLQRISDLNEAIDKFNNYTGSEVLKSSLEKAGDSSKSIFSSIQELANTLGTGQYVNPFSLGDEAHRAIVNAKAIKDALSAAKKAVDDLPLYEELTLAINRIIRLLDILKCLQPIHCFSFTLDDPALTTPSK